MVRQFQNITDSYNWIIQQTDRELDTILVINPYRRDTCLVATQHLILQRLDLVQGLNTRCRLQCFDSLLVPLDDIRLEPMLFVGCLAFIVQFFQILLFKCYYHGAKILNNSKNSQNIEFFHQLITLSFHIFPNNPKTFLLQPNEINPRRQM